MDQASGSSRSGAVLGRAPPKRGWGTKAKPPAKKESDKSGDGTDGSRPAFAPRSQAKKVQAPQYKDRAAIRRAGGDGEYKEVEHLLEEFERRKVEAGEDADKREYLGGDAEHSVLVKGLDYALLARRKAEIEAEKAAGMEDELEQLGQTIKSKSQSKEQPVEPTKDPKGNKTIGKKAPVEEPQRRRKTVEREIEHNEKATKPAQRPRSPVKPPPPPDPEDEEDIFADAGEYDLKAGREDEDDDDDSDEEGQMDIDEPQRRSRSRSRARQRSSSRSDSRGRGRSRSRSLSDGEVRRSKHDRYRSTSREHSYSRSRSRSRGYRERSYGDNRGRDAYNYDDRGRGRYDDYDYDRPRDNEWRRTERDRREDRSRRYDDRSRYSQDRDYGRHGGRGGSGPARERRPRTESRSRSRSPRYRDKGDGRADRGARPRSRTRSPSPVPSPRRARSRSLTPLLQQTLPFERSPTPESDDEGPVTRLQPLASSAITDLRGFLAADEADAKADARRASKARWRAAQGLAMQEGVDASMLKRTQTDDQKANREYRMLMHRLNKDKDKDGKDKGSGGPSK
ncbi:unnamed protein product [Cutaneotrichosporon oleaginosum]